MGPHLRMMYVKEKMPGCIAQIRMYTEKNTSDLSEEAGMLCGDPWDGGASGPGGSVCGEYSYAGGVNCDEYSYWYHESHNWQPIYPAVADAG